MNNSFSIGDTIQIENDGEARLFGRFPEIIECNVVICLLLEDSTLSKPKLTSPNSPGPVTTVTLLMNETFQVDCKGDTQIIEWFGPPHFWKIPEDA